MLEQTRLYSFNFVCPEIKATPYSTFNNVEGSSYYARYHKKRNSNGHQALLLTDIPGSKVRLEFYNLNPSIKFDYLDLTPDECLPDEVSPFIENNDEAFNLLRILQGSNDIDQEWFAMFTVDVLSGSMNMNQMPFVDNADINKAHGAFKEVTDQYPDKKVLVVKAHGGGNPPLVGERYGTVMPTINMLQNLISNLSQFSDGKPFSEKYSCVLLGKCDEAGTQLPDSLGKYLGVRVFYVSGKGGESIDHPKVIDK